MHVMSHGLQQAAIETPFKLVPDNIFSEQIRYLFFCVFFVSKGKF